MVRWRRREYVEWLDQGAMAVLAAIKRPDLYGQVTEVTTGHVEIAWENGRVCQYGDGSIPWLLPCMFLEVVG